MMSDKDQSGLARWLGRQIGFVRQAMALDVTQRKIYRQERVQERPMPGQPEVILRRRTIDEVVVKDCYGTKRKSTAQANSR